MEKIECLNTELAQLNLQRKREVIYSLIETASVDDQLVILGPILSSTSGYVKWRLQVMLCGQDTPDLLMLLPPELQLLIFSFLDGPSLLRAYQVSQAWRRTLIGLGEVWTKKCKELGMQIENSPTMHYGQHTLVRLLRTFSSLATGVAFREQFIYLQNCCKTVKAVDYQDGFLCTVSDTVNIVSIWQLDLNIPLMTFPVEQSVSCIKFEPHSLLVCGHFFGILTSWDLSDMASGTCVQLEYGEELALLVGKFKMHAGPIFSCDFDSSRDLLISGAGDHCIKFWSLKTCQILRTLPNQSHWVLRLILMPSRDAFSDNQVFSMTRDDVCQISWPSAHADIIPNICTAYGDVNRIEQKLLVRLQREGDSNFYTPGLQCCQKYFGLVQQEVSEKAATLCMYDIESFQLVNEIPLQFKVKKLLALGKRYAMLLSPGNALFSSQILIIDTVTKKTIGRHQVPHSKMTTPDGAQLIVGDTNWLDGLNHIVDCSVPSGDVNQVDKNDTTLSSVPSLTCEKLNEHRRFVLAAGIHDKPGCLFTLWWAQERVDNSCKFKEE